MSTVGTSVTHKLESTFWCNSVGFYLGESAIVELKDLDVASRAIYSIDNMTTSLDYVDKRLY